LYGAGDKRIVVAFYTVYDLTRTIIHLMDMFWELLLSAWRFIFRCTVILFYLTLPVEVPLATMLKLQAQEGPLMIDVFPTRRRAFQIKATELDSTKFMKKISDVTGMPKTSFKIFTAGKKGTFAVYC